MLCTFPHCMHLHFTDKGTLQSGNSYANCLPICPCIFPEGNRVCRVFVFYKVARHIILLSPPHPQSPSCLCTKQIGVRFPESLSHIGWLNAWWTAVEVGPLGWMGHCTTNLKSALLNQPPSACFLTLNQSRGAGAQAFNFLPLSLSVALVGLSSRKIKLADNACH